ncbi:histone-arginine methyltransferase METTL23-like [Dysidea avara]|uniref:histone-arginine methyltransferase METTL23-like n=1 Tax=Dysidea avara TaxID=196820 RepID=UPI003323B06C
MSGKIRINEALGADYGLFTWPCAPLLAQYVIYQRKYLKDKSVLEIGAGTGVPGLTAARCGAHVTLSDHHDNHHILESLRRSCDQNGLNDVKVIPLTWGCFTPSLVSLPPQDVVLASDCLYDTKEFEDVIVTFAYLLEKNPLCEVWMTYQERSSGRSLHHLLSRWELTLTTIPTDHLTGISLDIDGIGSNVAISNQTIHLWKITRTTDEQ